MNKVVSFLFIAFLLISCSEYQKALKSDDVAVKSEAANKMFVAFNEKDGFIEVK